MNIINGLAHNMNMRFRKNIVKTLIIFFAVIFCTLTLTPLSANAETDYLYLGGFPAGFTLKTTTVEVVGICDVITHNGLCSPARESGIMVGDVIESINGVEVNGSDKINGILNEDYKKFNINILRNGERFTFDIVPAKDLSTGKNRLGVLVKDTINGIGTVTYVDKKNNKFASLGHPVSDVNNDIIQINGGTVYNCLIYDIKKGVKGAPGELHGAFNNNGIIGKAALNCSCGIYGDLSDKFDVSNLTKIEKGDLEDVKIGSANIYTTLSGNKVKKYDISIVKTDRLNKDNRNFVIKIEDDELMDIAGGIVQGMSGSPIVQNGKIIGAVTHVFINDPTRGYGIAIDKMLSSY